MTGFVIGLTYFTLLMSLVAGTLYFSVFSKYNLRFGYLLGGMLLLTKTLLGFWLFYFLIRTKRADGISLGIGCGLALFLFSLVALVVVKRRSRLS